MRQWFSAAVCWAALALPASAEGLAGWNLAPPEFVWEDWTGSLGGQAGGTVFAPSGPSQAAGASLAAQLYPHLERTLDNGWEIGFHGAILASHDRLAGDPYGDRTFEKVWLFAQTPYGRFEMGENDGAAYRIGVTGPSIDGAVALDGATTSFFRDPATGRALIDRFRLQSAVFATGNNAKFSYTSPRWHGLELASSYTPYDAHGGLPFVSRGEGGSDRQTNILEGAASYEGSLGTLSYALSAGAAHGQDDVRSAGHDGLRDWGFGGNADDNFAGVKFSLGGAYRQSNAYAFDIADARASGETRSWRFSTTATRGPWIAGVEYASGTTDAAPPQSGLHEHGVEASLGYVMNSNLQVTTGWQRLDLDRDMGVFFNGAPSLHLNAAFLHLKFHV